MPGIRENSTSILALVVLYKTLLSESLTIESILNQKNLPAGFRLIIWDNSPQPVSLAEQNWLRKKISFEYVSKTDNTPLSRVYNDVVAENEFDFVFLLDQDTGIPESYISEVYKKTKEHSNVHLFLPIVKNQQLIVSPGNFEYFKGKHWKQQQSGLLSSVNLLAVTSGMLISKNYFKKHQYRFDERLNLYGIDSKFMIEYARNESQLYVLNIPFAHNSALRSEPTADALLPRFRNVKKAWSIILDDRPFAKALNFLHSKYASVKLALKYKDIRFLY